LEKAHNTALRQNDVSAWGVTWFHPFRSSRFSQHFEKTFCCIFNAASRGSPLLAAATL
jgi:hypothetical protein